MGYFEDYSKLHTFKKPDLKLFETFTLPSPDCFRLAKNSYVVIDDAMPIDYMSDYYEFLDDDPVGGLTYGGYVSNVDGILKLINLNPDPLLFGHRLVEREKEIVDELKKYSFKVIGFGNQHYQPNELGAKAGSKYLARQLHNYFLKNEVYTDD